MSKMVPLRRWHLSRDWEGTREKAKATPGKRALLVMGVERRVREEEALREVRGPDL